MVADAHLDTQWNWDVQATIKNHIWNTMVQNFHLLRQYPDYIFNFEGGVKYSWMKEYYPEQYEELKRWVATGRWHLAGSSWDACETIVCSPESWIRNILLGQTFYRQEFQREGTDVFLPDCFGFPFTMPTLARHCGLIGFSSQKLQWRTKPFYEGNRKYPFSVGIWRGIDGSEIYMAHGFSYAERFRDGEDLSHNEMLQREAAESPQGLLYRYYGTGDIGGSPTVGSVRAIEKGLKGDGPVKIISATSDQRFKEAPLSPPEGGSIDPSLDSKSIEAPSGAVGGASGASLPHFTGELTIDLHGNGCYTSQAAMKLYNRQNEHLGDAAERMAVVADWAGAYKYPIRQMTDTWRRVIWHHFHDDLTGTSIPRAYEFSWNDELLALKQFSDVLTTSVGGLVRQMDTNVSGSAVVVYNNESYKQETLPLPLPVREGSGHYRVVGPEGKEVLSQVVYNNSGEPELLFEATAPPMGLAVYNIQPVKGKKLTNLPSLGEGSGVGLSNSVYNIMVDSNGDITSLYDKQAGRELVAEGRSLRLVVFDDCRSEAWPAWEIHKRTLDKEPVGIHDDVSVTIEEDGPLRKSLCIKKKYGETEITQHIRLYEGSQARRIDIENVVDWRSENALLKAEFPLSVSNPEATYDIGLGCIRRGNNRDNQYEVYSHEWTDLTDRSGQYGVTILNDSRYGWDKPADNTLRLSLLYAPKPGGAYVYQAHQDKGRHVFTYSIVGHEGELNLVDANRQAAALNSPLRAFEAPKHKGTLGRTFSFVESSNPNVVIRTMKRAEVSDEYVVRVHELSGKTEQQATLTFAADIVKAVEADGTERSLHQAVANGRELRFTIKPFSVKTFKLTLRHPDRQPEAPAQAAVPLDYNKKCFTFNEFRGEADFEGGYSYAAEQMPAGGLTVDGIDFRFGEPDGQNGLVCRGDTLQLPAGQWSHVYLLAASNKGDRQATFRMGKASQTLEVPFYTGFVGQWGHDGQTAGHLKQAQVGWIGTHRHSPQGDEPYEFTYMFKLRLDVPKGATQVVLPNDEHIVVFAATAANDVVDAVPAAPLFRTSNRDDLSYQAEADAEADRGPSLLKDARILSYSGYVNDRERPELIADGDPTTKWCDTHRAPNYISFDLGAVKAVSRWHLLNAGSEMQAYVTRTCLLQGRSNEQEEWQTLDMIDGNRQNDIDRTFTPVSVRYVRLYVVGPTQTADMDAVRIYEFDLW
ncbi:MAG: discoidin domain-containing protein [Prevotella sp.]|nr:discoidin domain-containing protein [Prevotella sp.]